jgi:hypothetical protein
MYTKSKLEGKSCSLFLFLCFLFGFSFGESEEQIERGIVVKKHVSAVS